MQYTDYQILDAIEASIYWKDLNGKYLGCNRYMLNMIGLTRDEIIGKTDYLLCWKDDAAKLREVDELVADNAKRYEFEETITNEAGIKKSFLSSKSPLLDDNGKVKGVIGVSVDITHRKKFEREFAKTEESLQKYSSIKTRFLRNVSHEARIPMGSVLSISESLNSNWDQYDEATRKESLELLLKEAKRLSQFILNTFDMSKFTKGEIQPKFSKNDLTGLVHNIVQNYTKTFCGEKINIQINSEENCELVFDKELVTRVIENLLMNAVQYSFNAKDITVKISKSYMKNGIVPSIVCLIIDEGIGIPDNELKNIFNPFVESSRTASKAQGQGLGLSLCKEIIELHSGEIWAENNPNKLGATFGFSLPTTLFAFSSAPDFRMKEESNEFTNIKYADLKKIYPGIQKEPFGLVAISPFNSYFSSEKISEILEWTNDNYEDFAIFFPDEISKYNLIALGYDDIKACQKVLKQDKYMFNKIDKVLAEFLQQHVKTEVNIYTITNLMNNNIYQDLYTKYLKLFYNDKEFREGCFQVSRDYLSGHFRKRGLEINEYQYMVAMDSAVKYFVSELPVMMNMANILQIKSCDYIYHDTPEFLKKIAADENLMPPNQKFLVLK